jgi:serine/threonine protein kinase
MFAQMCDAVAACHAQNVFHRDIKPENFIVTDGWTTLPDGRQERKVVVKLTDFGLSTTDLESSDMDCGSAPYMSYGVCTCFFAMLPCMLTAIFRMQE